VAYSPALPDWIQSSFVLHWFEMDGVELDGLVQASVVLHQLLRCVARQRGFRVEGRRVLAAKYGLGIWQLRAVLLFGAKGFHVFSASWPRVLDCRGALDEWPIPIRVAGFLDAPVRLVF
jgi:hypothetical protein